eukprot:8321273-Lingulodinium_polyedra.AAC.1
MIEGAARARIKRAADTRAQASGEALELSVGVSADFYHPQQRNMSPGGEAPQESPMHQTPRVVVCPCGGRAMQWNA